MEKITEDTIWKGHSSQLINLGTHLVCALLAIGIVVGGILSGFPLLSALIVLPLGWSLWKYITIRCRVFVLTSERLRLYEGVLNQNIAEVELYRVKDTNISRPFWLRVFGLASIKLDTSDRTLPVVNLDAVKNGLKVRELIRKQVEVLRDRKRVREVDFDGAGDEIEFES